MSADRTRIAIGEVFHMPTLHDASYRATVRARVEKLRKDAPKQWGTMSLEQMLWHCNQALEQSLGRCASGDPKTPMPKAIMRFFVLNVPWPKGAPTAPELLARDRYDFKKERARCLKLIDEVAARDIRSEWPPSGLLGRMAGRDWSRLMAKHLDHHLRQFGA